MKTKFDYGKQQGFGLIEILVTVVVLAVGILGVSILNSELTKRSQDNKARAEAMTLAESRIEAMRNYTSLVGNQTDFDALFGASGTYQEGNTSLNGTNADTYLRDTTITVAGNSYDINVEVSWTNIEDEEQSVSLDTIVSYISPRTVADDTTGGFTSSLLSPTGRATLGAGTDTISGGTSDFTYSADGGKKLAISEDSSNPTEGTVVLTLSCGPGVAIDDDTTDDCGDYARISGTVYIDVAAKHNFDPGAAFIAASDSGYCSRYFIDTPANGPELLTNVTSLTTSTILTDDVGDYEVFDYACYVGPGWHGNIGVLLPNGVGPNDRTCIGDPTSANAWDQPVIATRRAYRGMMYKIDGSAPDGKELITGTSEVRYYSHGIVEGARFEGHDFVITEINSLDGADCTGSGAPMSYTDAGGHTANLFTNIFAGMPGDFICLNDISQDLDEDLSYTDTALDHYYDTSVFAPESQCNYDPTNPPINHYTITTQVYYTGTTDAVVTDPAFSVITSDGTSCYVSGGYICDVYDWDTDVNDAGWVGYVEVDSTTYDSSALTCGRHTEANLIADGTATIFCTAGAYTYISGNIGGNRDLGTATLVAITNETTPRNIGGPCIIAADALSYSCATLDFSVDGSPDADWDGYLTFTAAGNNNVICDNPYDDTSPKHFSGQGAANIENYDIQANNRVQDCP